MDFNEKGFLGTAIIEFSDSFQKKHSDFFDACYQINELAQEIKFNFKIHDKDIQEVLASPLFIRILNGFQAVITLSKLGLVFDAKVVLRGILEALFLLKAICDDEKFATDYVRTDKLRRLKWMELAHQNQDPIFTATREYSTLEIIKTLKAEISKYEIKNFSTESVARKAKLELMYNTDYRLLSAEVHSIPFALGHYYSLDEKEEIKEFPWGPSDNDLKYILFVAIRIIFISLFSMTILFGIEAEYTKKFTEIDQTLTRLASMLKVGEDG